MKTFSVQIKKFFTFDVNASGFTLIELLVVIGILGILAAALIATIDPFEQLKKAQDANVQNTAVEYVDANVRYYVTHNALPWSDTSNANVSTCTSLYTAAGATVDPVSLTAAAAADCLNGLIADGELKAGFTTVTGTLKTIYASSGGKSGENNVVACYRPQSKAGADDTNCKYNQTGVVDNTVTHVPGDANECYWCSE